jgi:uncharacterized metal-binding protein
LCGILFEGDEFGETIVVEALIFELAKGLELFSVCLELCGLKNF